ncbi:MAG: hypothetical protein H6825_08215 [Planctomycetes bacterium]|nr:hypothetical protein [Planctomycetota bacterium]
MIEGRHIARALGMAALLLCGGACLTSGGARAARTSAIHGWWAGLGPVLPHDSFPADCAACHEPDGWHHLVDDFSFDHARQTGVPLEGAHARAQCLRCHNDRGPVAEFAALGCVGCHEDVHRAQLGADCSSCHSQRTWVPRGRALTLHQQTRFPLVGVHASTSCRRCHDAGEIGVFLPVDTACVSCHTDDLYDADNPNHIALGWVDECDGCHKPVVWNDAQTP